MYFLLIVGKKGKDVLNASLDTYGTVHLKGILTIGLDPNLERQESMPKRIGRGAWRERVLREGEESVGAVATKQRR